MAQTGTTIITLDSPATLGPRVLKLAWTATAGGAVTTDTDSSGYANLHGYGGLDAAVFVPGTPNPSAAYDVVITDARGYDVLVGNGANLTGGATTDTKRNGASSVVLGPVSGPLTLAITNAGASAQGIIYLYIR